MAASMQKRTSNKKRKKRRNKIIKILCLTAILSISIFGGYKIAYKYNYKEIKVLGASVNGSTKQVNGNSSEDIDKKQSKAEKDNSGKTTNNEDSSKKGNTDNSNKDSSYNGDKEPSKPVNLDNTNAVKVEDAFKKDGVKTAFLTFDDGPSKTVTPEILKTLDKYKIKATFFVIGKMAEENKDLVKEEYKNGHSIGNHTYNHDKKAYSGLDGFKQEFESTNNTLKNILGPSFNSRLFRFPGGGFESYKTQYKNYLKERGYVYIDWNALNGDAEGNGFSAERLINRLKSTAGGQEHLVILMHDAPAKKSTAEALPAIIEYLKSQGYEFKTLK